MKQIDKMLELLTRRDDRSFEPLCEALIVAGFEKRIVERYFEKQRRKVNALYCRREHHG